MNEFLTDYYSALGRLVANKPNTVAKGTKITNDSVALEAGRKKGSIKKSRPVYSELISHIKDAHNKKLKSKSVDKEKLIKAKVKSEKYKKLWEDSMAGEISLLYEVHQLKEQISKINDLNSTN